MKLKWGWNETEMKQKGDRNRPETVPKEDWNSAERESSADQAACFFYSSSGCSFLALKVRWNNAEIVLKQQWNIVKEACWLTNSRLSFRVVSDLFKSCFSPPSRLCHGCFGFLSASFQFHFSSNSSVQFSGDRFLVARTLRQAWTILEFSRTSCVMLFVKLYFNVRTRLDRFDTVMQF